MKNNAKIKEFNVDKIVIEFDSGVFEVLSIGKFTWTPNNDLPTYDELYEYWLKTKDKPKRKRKSADTEQLLGQISLFDTAE
jgi:hypothetical protein